MLIFLLMFFNKYCLCLLTFFTWILWDLFEGRFSVWIKKKKRKVLEDLFYIQRHMLFPGWNSNLVYKKQKNKTSMNEKHVICFVNLNTQLYFLCAVFILMPLFSSPIYLIVNFSSSFFHSKTIKWTNKNTRFSVEKAWNSILCY